MNRTFISLGDHCDVGDGFRNFFGKEPSSPFDWLITPTHALIDILNTRGDKFGLSISYAMDGFSVMCESYGCLYHHEFERNANNICVITPEHLKNCRDKLTYKFKKMVSLSAAECNPVFIRKVIIPLTTALRSRVN
jgi:hypothetical protein